MNKLSALLLMLCLSAIASAQQDRPAPKDQGGAPPAREHRGPPKEAFDACKGKKEGDAVETTTPRGDKVSGSCRMVMIPTRPPEGARERDERPHQQ